MNLSQPRFNQHYLFIGCEVLFREICLLTAYSPHHIDHHWLSQGLHDLGASGMSIRLQAEIDAIPAQRYDAILLGFGLCNNGITGLTSPHTPLVIPRAHDCISFFLGSRQRYDTVFAGNTGTYFLTPGWIERDEVNLEAVTGTIQDRLGLVMTREEMSEAYGEENLEFLVEQMGDLTSHYSQITYIDTGVDRDGHFYRLAEAEADTRGLLFSRLEGDLALLEGLLAGGWGDDYLVVAPGNRVAASHDSQVICCLPCSGPC